MSNSDGSLKYRNISFHQEEYESGNRSRGSHRLGYNKRPNPFFRRPYVETGSLIPYPVDVTIGTGLNSDQTPKDPEMFEGIVWVLPMRNKEKLKMTTQATNCYARVQINRDGVTIGNEVPLLWRTYAELPTVCNTEYPLWGKKERRNECRDALAFYYVKEIKRQSRLNATIPKGLSNEIFLVFTFKESEYAYLITSLIAPARIPDLTLLYHGVDGFSLARPFGEEISCQIRFDSLEHSEKNARRFRIKVNSWDNVSLIPHTSRG